MVGVPRSKGCSVCRERRIKCDEARPQCTQCRRYGCPCPGYNRSLKFQDEGPGLQRRHRKTKRRLSNDIKQSSAATRDPRTPTESPVEDSPGSALMVLRHYTAAHPSMDQTVSPSLVQKAFQNQQPLMFKDFICAAFPTLYFQNRFRSGDSPDFVQHIVENFGIYAYEDAAVGCLSTVYLAHLTQDISLMRASRTMYADALRKVNYALNSKDALSDHMLVSIMMLTVYEMYARTSPDAWEQHAIAAEMLMRKRGVAAHMSGFGRSCYLAFRGFITATCMHQAKPCFLDEKEWQDFADQVRTEDSQKPSEWSAFVEISEQIIHELVKCPRYFSQASELDFKVSPSEAAALNERIRSTYDVLRAQSEELRTSLAAHSQRKQGIIVRPESFIGPVPKTFPDTNASLLLLGATNAADALEQLLQRLSLNEGDEKIVASEDVSSAPASGSDWRHMPPAWSPRSPRSTDRSTSVPSPSFRVVSEISRGPSQTTDRNDPHAVTWLDRIASSMGMLGASIQDEFDDSAPPFPAGRISTVEEVDEE